MKCGKCSDVWFGFFSEEDSCPSQDLANLSSLFAAVRPYTTSKSRCHLHMLQAPSAAICCVEWLLMCPD